MTRDELQAIATVIKDTNIVVLSDEIYNSPTLRSGSPRLLCGAGRHERAHHCCGRFLQVLRDDRLASLAAMGPKELMRHICKIHQFGIMSAPTTAQFAGIEAIRTGEDDIERMREQYDLRRRYLLGELRSHGSSSALSRRARSICSRRSSPPDFPVMMNSARLLHEQEVAVIPGSAFGESGEGRVRISYSVLDEPSERLAAGFVSFADALNNGKLKMEDGEFRSLNKNAPCFTGCVYFSLYITKVLFQAWLRLWCQHR